MKTARSPKRSIAVVTGTRAEFGLLRSVMRAIQSHDSLELRVIATGTHLLPPQSTIEEIQSEFKVFAIVPMQEPNQIGRDADARAIGRGVSGFAEFFAGDRPDIVLVLGDRIEPLAATVAASIAGIHVAHMHGGDRGDGVADDAIRHAITKLAHIHFPATATSSQRLVAMGEEPQRIHVVGSPAIDDVFDMPAASDTLYAELGRPEVVVLMHPIGDQDEVEHERAAGLLRAASKAGRVLALHPNHDHGRRGILRAIEECGCPHRPHLHRREFVGVLRRAKVLVGNSSAGLIECGAIPVRSINIGSRQHGRERPSSVMDIKDWDYQTIQQSLNAALTEPPLTGADVKHPFGEGRAGQRSAESLATLDLKAHSVAKRNAY